MPARRRSDRAGGFCPRDDLSSPAWHHRIRCRAHVTNWSLIHQIGSASAMRRSEDPGNVLRVRRVDAAGVATPKEHGDRASFRRSRAHPGAQALSSGRRAADHHRRPGPIWPDGRADVDGGRAASRTHLRRRHPACLRNLEVGPW